MSDFKGTRCRFGGQSGVDIAYKVGFDLPVDVIGVPVVFVMTRFGCGNACPEIFPADEVFWSESDFSPILTIFILPHTAAPL